MCPAVDLGPVHAVEHLAKVGRERDQHLRALAAYAHETDRGLGVCLCFGGEDHVDGIGLRFPSRGPMRGISRAF